MLAENQRRLILQHSPDGCYLYAALLGRNQDMSMVVRHKSTAVEYSELVSLHRAMTRFHVTLVKAILRYGDEAGEAGDRVPLDASGPPATGSGADGSKPLPTSAAASMLEVYLELRGITAATAASSPTWYMPRTRRGTRWPVDAQRLNYELTPPPPSVFSTTTQRKSLYSHSLIFLFNLI